jgi:hypothetical protein
MLPAVSPALAGRARSTDLRVLDFKLGRHQPPNEKAEDADADVDIRYFGDRHVIVAAQADAIGMQGYRTVGIVPA